MHISWERDGEPLKAAAGLRATCPSSADATWCVAVAHVRSIHLADVTEETRQQLIRRRDVRHPRTRWKLCGERVTESGVVTLRPKGIAGGSLSLTIY